MGQYVIHLGNGQYLNHDRSGTNRLDKMCIWQDGGTFGIDTALSYARQKYPHAEIHIVTFTTKPIKQIEIKPVGSRWDL